MTRPLIGVKQLVLHRIKMGAQTLGHMGVVAVDGLHPARHVDQLGQLLAMHRVKAGEDVVDHLVGRLRHGLAGRSIKLGQRLIR